MTTKKKPGRAERRERERALSKLASQREKLARLEAGGAPSRPIVVPSASVIEVHATTMKCLRCDGDVRVDEHRAETLEGHALRIVVLRCRMCGATRDVYFDIVTNVLN